MIKISVTIKCQFLEKVFLKHEEVGNRLHVSPMQSGLQNAYEILVSKSGQVLFLKSDELLFPLTNGLIFSKFMDHLQGNKKI